MSLQDFQMDRIIGKIGDWFLDGRFDKVDRYLRTRKIEDASVLYLVCILSASVAGKSFLKERDGFVLRAEKRFIELDPDQVEPLMRGLR